MERYLMKCGHISNAVLHEGQPVCAICFGVNDGACAIHHKCTGTNGIDGREAICSECGRKIVSEWNLPFFEYREYKPNDTYYCGCNGWD